MNKLNKKIFNKILLSLFAVFVLSSCVYGINIEYKNSLSRVELLKNSDDSYTVNLYTSKKFLDPVKVIKKNDLNYYILLPETKNSTGAIAATSSDIRNVTTKSYPYAGQDVNNGYTKINITTNKPITFNVNIKTHTNGISGAAAAAKLPPMPFLEEEKTVQKKIAQNTEKVKEDNNKAKINEDINEKETKKEIKNTTRKTVDKNQKRKSVLENAIANNYNADIKDPFSQQTENQNSKISEEIINDFETVLQNESEQEKDLREDLSEEKSNFAIQNFIAGSIETLKKASAFINKLGINIVGLFVMMASGIFVFFVVLYALTRKQKPTPKIKNRIDLLDKKATPKKPFTNSGEYFVLNNVKQSVFSDPTSSAIKRNYELTSYNPETANYEKMKRTKINKEKNNDEYDIIQKILKEDSVVKFNSSEYDVMDSPTTTTVIKKQDEIIAEQIEKEDVEIKPKDIKEIATSPIEKEVKLEIKIPNTNEPFVISKAEITPEKGFMLVSYNNNISLMGYIFDDVFALYNFKASKLDDYEITYRQADKDEYGINYIVKADSVRLMVRVAKTSMKMRIVL